MVAHIGTMETELVFKGQGANRGLTIYECEGLLYPLILDFLKLLMIDVNNNPSLMKYH